MTVGAAAPRAIGRRVGHVRADVIRQFHERGEDGMVEVLAELEANDLLRLQVIDELRKATSDA